MFYVRRNILAGSGYFLSKLCDDRAIISVVRGWCSLYAN